MNNKRQNRLNKKHKITTYRPHLLTGENQIYYIDKKQFLELGYNNRRVVELQLPFIVKSSILSSSSITITTLVSWFQRRESIFLNTNVSIDCWNSGNADSGVLPQEMAMVGTSSLTDSENAHSKHPRTRTRRLAILTVQRCSTIPFMPVHKTKTILAAVCGRTRKISRGKWQMVTKHSTWLIRNIDFAGKRPERDSVSTLHAVHGCAYAMFFIAVFSANDKRTFCQKDPAGKFEI